ncbi:TPA_asm: P [Hibiscus gammacytorhabdovirus 1]|nr:TPA_asm: P [Hibiscus gammacytorhabdovirus 1]
MVDQSDMGKKKREEEKEAHRQKVLAENQEKEKAAKEKAQRERMAKKEAAKERAMKEKEDKEKALEDRERALAEKVLSVPHGEESSNKSEKSEQSDDEQTILDEEAKLAANIIDTVTRKVESGLVDPEFQHTGNPIIDSTNADLDSASEISKTITNKTVHQLSASSDKGKNAAVKRDNIEEIMIRCSREQGVLIQGEFVEDMIAMGTKTGDDITEHEIIYYLRGVRMANQVNMIRNLGELARSLESASKAASSNLSNVVEIVQKLDGRISRMANDIKGVTTAVSSVVVKESSNLKSLLMEIVKAITSLGSASSSRSSKSSPSPAAEDLEAMCEYLKCSSTMTKVVSTNMVGQLGWEDYNDVMSGKMGRKDLMDKIDGIIAKLASEKTGKRKK